MSVPAMWAIRRRWPEAEITILGRPAIAELYEGQDFANRAMSLSGNLKNPFFAERQSRELRKERFDCAVLFQNAFSAAWLAWRAKIPKRIGYARDARGLLLTRAIAVPETGEIPAHEAYYYLELLRRAGWLDELPKVEQISLKLNPEIVTRAEARIREAGARGGARIALAPGASYGSAKCWPPERFAAVADGLVDEFGADVILFGTSSEIEICRKIAERMRHRPVSFAGQTRMNELPGLFSRCQLFLGNDSGAMHVAAAVGLPVVAVFGSTDPEGTAPITANKILVRHAVSCSPCFLRECPIDHRCMMRVPVEDVRRAAAKMIEEGRVAQSV
jgi:heptosyltransferase-2